MRRHMAAALFLIMMAILTGCNGKAKEAGPEEAEVRTEAEQDAPSENAGAGDTSLAEDEIYPAYEPHVTYPPHESAGRDRAEPEDQEEDRGPEYVIVVDGRIFADGLYHSCSNYKSIYLENEDRTLGVDVDFENKSAAKVEITEMIRTPKGEHTDGECTVRFLDDCSVMPRTDYEKLYSPDQQQDA